MSSDEVKKPAEVAKLVSDLQNAKIELLSAQCAADRLRLQYSLKDIVTHGERQTLERAIASVRSLERFFSQVESQIRAEEDANR